MHYQMNAWTKLQMEMQSVVGPGPQKGGFITRLGANAHYVFGELITGSKILSKRQCINICKNRITNERDTLCMYHVACHVASHLYQLP